MKNPAYLFSALLCSGLLVTLSAAVNVCPGVPLNETSVCANVTAVKLDVDICSNSLQQFACSNTSTMAAFLDNLLVNLSSCYNNDTLQALDSVYFTLLFSKLDNNKTNAMLSQLNSKFSSLASAWNKLLLVGIWSRITQNLNGSSSPQQWIPSDVQPFLLNINPDMVQCLQDRNVSCAAFQELVKNLDVVFPNMTRENKVNLYPALKSFLQSRQRLSGWACSQNVNTSEWIKQNFGKFVQLANFSDFAALNENFSALDVLPLLTPPQIAAFSLDLGATNSSAAITSVLETIRNANDVFDFLGYINAAAMSRNMTALRPLMAQALLNKTFETIKSNVSMFTTDQWTQLFQDKLTVVLPEITPEQLSLVPQSISCGSYQVILKSLDFNFPKMNSKNQEEIYKFFMKPYLTKQGPTCAQGINSSALIKLNFGKFSQFADYKDFVALNGNFSAGDVLSSLTMQQVIDFSLDPTINTTVAAGIVGMIQNVTDVNRFLASLKASALTNNVSSLSPYLSQALLTKTFQILKPNINSFSNSDWTQLFQDKLSLVLPQISKDQLSLIPSNISCSSYQSIFNSLQSRSSEMNSKNQKDVYKYFIKPYLKMKGNAITCYTQTDATASAWLANNVGFFMTYTSEEDLILFANDSMLQTFANDPSCVQLASKLKLPKDTAIYFTSLLTSSQAFNLSSIPDTFLCYLKPSALKNLNVEGSLDIIKKINKQCFNTPVGQSTAAPTPEEVQVAISLVSKLNNFSSDTLMSLGQSAVGLSPGQINSISDSDLQSSVSSLGNVTGWRVGQARSIMTKLLNSNFKIQNLGSLGSLVTGLPSKKLQELDPAQVLNAVKDTQFTSKLSSAPPALQNMFVKQIIAANSTSSTVVKNVPASLASFIPKSLLLFNSEKPSLQDVNGKSWSPDQAAMFFDDIATNTTDYSQLSSSVLQGFTCATPSKISNNQVKMLGKCMKTQNAALSEDQLNCLSRQITQNGYPTDLDSYPKEVFLFLNSANYSSIGNCTDFYTNVGKANISIMSKGNKLRSNLLANSLACMNTAGSSLTDSNIQVLGQLSCDLSPQYIVNSSPSILTQLSQCQSFTAEQQSSIQTLLAKNDSVFGNPSTWTKDTLNSLGGISGFLTKETLTSIPSVSFKSWMQAAIENSALTRSQFASIVNNLTPPRARRAAGCAAGKQITADNVNDNLLPLSYTAAELDACLDNNILINYLSMLSSKPFTNDQLTVLKNKLDALYPIGYPETILTNLGAITLICGDAEVNKWNITSVDTLSSLLAVGPSDTLATSIIGKFISSGNQLTDPALNVIGSRYICLLSSAQLNLITSSGISNANALDVSACSQTVKDALYGKSKAAYQGQTSQVSTYFNLIKPYLGGATAADLKSLAAQGPSMDIGTFVKLNPSAVLSLTVSDVKGLLGTNVADLKTQESNSVVSSWISVQKQSDLDTLGLGIQGGIRDNVTTKPPSSSASALTHGFSILLAVFGIFLLFEDPMQFLD